MSRVEGDIQRCRTEAVVERDALQAISAVPLDVQTLVDDSPRGEPSSETADNLGDMTLQQRFRVGASPASEDVVRPRRRECVGYDVAPLDLRLHGGGELGKIVGSHETERIRDRLVLTPEQLVSGHEDSALAFIEG